MRKIKLTKGKWALVDDSDYEWLSQWKWTYGISYAYRHINKGNKNIYMHRQIMQTPTGMETDHINRNKLDNRRENLRICTSSQNKMNKKAVGINWHKASKKWRAYINLKYKTIHLGLFKNKAEAQIARNQATKKYFGKFAYEYMLP